MKILIFNWQDIRNPLAGGAEVHLHEIFSRIAARGHAVTLYCSTFPGAAREETIDGIRVIREGGRGLFNYHVPWRYFTRFRSEAYDVVIDDMNKIPFFTPAFVREPLAIIIHHLFDRSIFLEAPWPVAMYVYRMEKWGLALARRHRTPVYVVSQSTKEEVRSAGIPGEVMDIVYNCVDHTRHQRVPGSKSATPLIGYFGRLKKYKSVDHLLTAFAGIRSSYPGCRLVIIGDGDDRPRLESVAADLGIADVVTFTGFVTEEEKVRLLQRMWFLVNTSSKEGWGLTVIEANACGTTVIASDVPGLRDAVRNGETGLLYRYGDIDDLSANIRLLLDNGERRKKLEDEAHRWAAKFNWDDMAEKCITLFANLISEHKRR